MSDSFKKLMKELADEEIKKMAEDLKDVAKIQKVLFDSYIEEGFSEKQALYLTAEATRPGGEQK